MIYSAIGLAVIGAAVGFAFRWKVLLPVIVLLPFAAVVFSVSRGLNHEDTAIVVVVAEAVLQGGYFAGLLIRFISAVSMRSAGFSSVFKSRRDAKARTSDERHTAPPAEAGKGP
jgi:hypothetical protein